jgi:hypothetical protein
VLRFFLTANLKNGFFCALPKGEKAPFISVQYILKDDLFIWPCGKDFLNPRSASFEGDAAGGVVFSLRVHMLGARQRHSFFLLRIQG